MGTSSNKSCDAATKKKLQNIHILVGKGPHNICNKSQKKLIPIEGNRSNAYMDAINVNNIDLSAHRFPPKSVHYLYSTIEYTINLALKQYDANENNKEEEYFANKQHDNLQSNANFEEDVYVDDWFVNWLIIFSYSNGRYQ